MQRILIFIVNGREAPVQLELLSIDIMDDWMVSLKIPQNPSTDTLGQLLTTGTKDLHNSIEISEGGTLSSLCFFHFLNILNGNFSFMLPNYIFFFGLAICKISTFGTATN